MLASAFAALMLFAAPDAAQAAASQTKASAETKAPKKTCYTATPSGSRMPRKVCVTQSAPKGDGHPEHSADKTPEPKPE